MTAKNSKKASDSLGRYYTPQWCVDQCFEHVVPNLIESEPVAMLEPGAGRGAFVKGIREWYGDAPIVHAVDLDPQVGPWTGADLSWHADFLEFTGAPLPSEEDKIIQAVRAKQNGVDPKTRYFGGISYDLIAGNPPYDFALDFIQKGITISRALVFILRQGFLASAKRAKFFREHPPYGVWNIPHRPSFTDDGHTDTADYCWVGWRRGYQGDTRLHWLPEVPVELRKKKVIVKPKRTAAISAYGLYE